MEQKELEARKSGNSLGELLLNNHNPTNEFLDSLASTLKSPSRKTDFCSLDTLSGRLFR